MKVTLLAAGTALALALALPAIPSARADTVSGTGRAVITKDVETVRNRATAAARREIVVALITQTIGADRLSEVPPQTIDAIAAQIRRDMITDESSQRDGTSFIVVLTAEVDGAWLRAQLDAHDIASSSARADGDRAMIFVMLDQVDDVASDFAAPAEAEIAYDRRTGGSFSDRSSVTASSRERSAASSRSASGYSTSALGASRTAAAGAQRSSGSAAYGASGIDGSAAGRSRDASGFSGSSAAAYSGRSAGASRASSSASDFADRTNVQTGGARRWPLSQPHHLSAARCQFRWRRDHDRAEGRAR